MKYLSLFSGIGGFELGIQQAYENTDVSVSPRSEQGRLDDEKSYSPINNKSVGTQQPHCVGFSEIDKYATQIYQSHFPEHKNYGDITKINADELPGFDLLVGGFPCQSFSIAGTRKGFDDVRGTMFFEIARILQSKRPRLLLLENVKGLLSHDSGRTFRVIIATLTDLGYDLQWQVLNSKNHGVPQNRERVFIVGHLRGTSRPEVFPFGDTDRSTGEGFNTSNTKSEVASTVRSRYGNGTGSHIKVSGILDTETWRKRHEQIRRVHDISGVSPTLPTGTGGGVMTKIEIEFAKVRRLTPTECERLQGFPDGWTEGLSDTQRYKTLGNAVTVNVIKSICKKLYV